MMKHLTFLVIGYLSAISICAKTGVVNNLEMVFVLSLVFFLALECISFWFSLKVASFYDRRDEYDQAQRRKWLGN